MAATGGKQKTIGKGHNLVHYSETKTKKVNRKDEGRPGIKSAHSIVFFLSLCQFLMACLISGALTSVGFIRVLLFAPPPPAADEAEDEAAAEAAAEAGQLGGNKNGAGLAAGLAERHVATVGSERPPLDWDDALAITASLFAITFISILTGAALPLVLQRMRLDPSNASTTIQVRDDGPTSSAWDWSTVIGKAPSDFRPPVGPSPMTLLSMFFLPTVNQVSPVPLICPFMQVIMDISGVFITCTVCAIFLPLTNI